MEVGYNRDETLSLVRSYYEKVKGVNDVQIAVERDFFKNKLSSLIDEDSCQDLDDEPLFVVRGRYDNELNLKVNIIENVTPRSLKAILGVVLKDEPFTVDSVQVAYRRMGDCNWPTLDFNGIKLGVTPKTKIKQKVKTVQK